MEEGTFDKISIATTSKDVSKIIQNTNKASRQGTKS